MVDSMKRKILIAATVNGRSAASVWSADWAMRSYHVIL